jgi:hypothetical protein
VSTNGRRAGYASSRWSLAARPENVVDRGGEIIQAGAWNDNCVSPAVSFFRYAEKFSAFVLAKFKMKSLPFNLNFFRFENAVHLKTSPESNEIIRRIGSKICAASSAALAWGERLLG